MLTDVTAIRTYFAKLGLDQEIADIYLALYAHGPQTISALSRNSGVERTRIYRLIDQLMGSNLIEVENRGARGVIKAAPISNLRILINKREQELKNLTEELELMEQVLARNSLSHGDSRVQIYTGAEGIRNALRNELHIATEVIGYTKDDLFRIVGKKFAENMSQEYKKRRVTQRFIDASNIGAAHSCHIYGDVIAYYFIDGNDGYALEIHDKRIAEAQRIFIYSVSSTSRQKAT